MDITINNVIDVKFSEFLDGLRPILTEEIPEGTRGDPEALTEIDRLIGRFANTYSYLITLYSVVANEANRLKMIGNQTEYHIMMRKKESLFEFARAIRYKQEACSRMLTMHMAMTEDDVFDQVDYKGRAKKVKAKKSGRVSRGGWKSVS